MKILKKLAKDKLTGIVDYVKKEGYEHIKGIMQDGITGHIKGVLEDNVKEKVTNFVKGKLNSTSKNETKADTEKKDEEIKSKNKNPTKKRKKIT